MRFLISAVLFSVLAASISGAELSDNLSPEAANLVMAPIRAMGQSRESIKEKLGPWISLETKTITNRHEVGQNDKTYTVKYDGLILTLYEVVKVKKEMLVSVRMTKNYPRILPELIGLKRGVVETRFGASKPGGETYKYALQDGIGENSVICKFDGDTLVQVEWSYYLD
jgi:hypothetical protein